MKLKKIKKILATFMLASSLTLSLGACSSEIEEQTTKVESFTDSYDTEEQISKTEIFANNYQTEDYYLVYLNGNIYLTYRNRKYIYFNHQKVVFYEHKDVRNDELIGTNIVLTYGEDVEKNDYKATYFDSRFYQGNYGVGMLIPPYATIPLKNIVLNEKFSQEEYDFFSSNSEELKNTIFNSISFNNYTVIDSFKPNRDHTPIFTEQPLKKFECTNTSGETNVYIGYRCSFQETDAGYNYIYDILSGSLIYIGQFKENSFTSIKETVYDNSQNKSLSTLKEEIKESGTELTVSENLYSSEDLYVVNVKDTLNHKENYVTSKGSVEDYIILYNRKLTDNESIYLQDPVNKKASLFLSQEDDFPRFSYCHENGTLCYGYKINCKMQNINEYLSLNNLSDLISLTEYYTEEQITDITNYLNQKQKSRTIHK